MKPLKERLEQLLSPLPADAPVAYSEHIDGRGEEVLQAMRRRHGRLP